MMEDAILTLAQAIEALAEAITRDKRVPAQITIEKAPISVSMDEAGSPTTFRYKCGICGEEGRNRQSCQEEMRDGTYHWMEAV
mgnify:CR=1 FL=1|tara:strand:- start:541 stop:789 length:249 start_codon:yes stop_codon:yes gene_type:complete